jgi:hypothetical protein
VESIKVYIANNKNIAVNCPECKSAHALDLTDKNVPYSITTKCACGYKYSIKFDKREYYRKRIKSTGICSSLTDSEDGKQVRIIDISRSGLAFIKDRGKVLAVGDNVKIEFILGEAKVVCMVTVASVLDVRIGARFNKLDEHTQKVIGFFLMP